MELLVEPIMELVKCLWRSACTYLDHHSNFNEAVSDLRRERENLNSQKEEINSKVQDEVLWGRKRKREVESWLHDVQQINDEVDEIEGKIERVKWYSRGHLGKLVCRKIEVVKKIRVDGCFRDGLVDDRPPTRGVIMSNDNPVGEDSAKEKIRGYLVGNEVRKIGVCGIGGRLRFSYDRLNNFEIQSCFLYCSLFPEDYPFQTEGLVEGWIDEGLIDVLPSRKAAYDRGHAFLNMLVKKCLLEKTVNWGDDVFKMHDVMRDMAIKSIGPEFGYMVKARMKLTEVPEEHGWGNDLKKVSLMENKISKIPLGLCPKCPTLSTLILSNNDNLSEIPKSFFEGMPELKVLDLSQTGIETLPNSISNLEKLSSMRLSECYSLRYLPSLAKLTALKKLDLLWCDAVVVPQGMEKLISLEYLDLSCCGNLGESPVGMLSNLSKLQYLSVYLGLEIKGEEVAGLKKLETFECEFDDIQGYNHFVNSQDFRILTDYGIAVGPFGSELDQDIHQRKPVVKIHHWNLGDERIVLPDNLQRLKIVQCGNMRSGLNKAVLLEKATELRSCDIDECEDMECVVDLNSSSCLVLDKLEELHLCRLFELSVLVRVEGVATPLHVFSNLKRLSIELCSMRKLLPLELLQTFQNLEKICVRHCWDMEEIIASSDSDASSDKFTFPKLRILWLDDLPQLKSICSAKGVMVCDSIEQIGILKCRELKRIPVQLPLLDNGQPSPPPCLREIYVDRDAKEWWESVEWDHKNLLQPFLKYSPWS
ncbi:hypothetical protein SLEP1_g57638 [Rubroshorea leprosula]|uniref:Disease resistance protein n=1 Tax=Rubroshorea leprosula TaxID=152421 RepID=A0AAV5MLT3_9ROSI|nr:hypothetical protein SLEP1_g57638 [Rubroshorea leprosula]